MKLLMYGVNRETVTQADVKKYSLDYKTKKLQMNEIYTFDGVEEIVILANDFRNEYYLYVDEKEFSHGQFLRYLSDETNKELEEVILDTYSKFNEDVLRHLYEISTGYVSDPIGSFDNLEAVEYALKNAEKLKTSGIILVKLFNEAINLSYTLKINDKAKPLNRNRISEYLYKLKEEMGSLKKKDFIISGDNFEVYHLTKLLLFAGAQSITITQKNEKLARHQYQQIKNKLSKIDLTKVYVATDKSIYYRLSKSDAVIINTSKINCLSKKVREEIATIRHTRKLQHLIDMSKNPINSIEDDKLDIQLVDTKTEISYNDEQKNNALVTFDEEISNYIKKFMKYLKKENIVSS